MLKVVNGLRYNTATADLIGTHRWDGNDFKSFAEFGSEDGIKLWSEASLYKTTGGRFFMTGRSLYESEPGGRFEVLSTEQAFDFASRHLGYSEYAYAFESQMVDA